MKEFPITIIRNLRVYTNMFLKVTMEIILDQGKNPH